jgi:hypothetical protein
MSRPLAERGQGTATMSAIRAWRGGRTVCSRSPTATGTKPPRRQAHVRNGSEPASPVGDGRCLLWVGSGQCSTIARCLLRIDRSQCAWPRQRSRTSRPVKRCVFRRDRPVTWDHPGRNSWPTSNVRQPPTASWSGARSDNPPVPPARITAGRLQRRTGSESRLQVIGLSRLCPIDPHRFGSFCGGAVPQSPLLEPNWRRARGRMPDRAIRQAGSHCTAEDLGETSTTR